jgi:hypothetical protein
MTQQIKEARQPRTHQRLRPILIELFQKTRANTEQCLVKLRIMQAYFYVLILN